MDRETLILGAYAFLLYAIGYEAYHCNENLEKLVAVAEQADAPALGAGIHRGCAGSTPVSDTNIERSIKMTYSEYRDSKGDTVLARPGLSNPVNENDPFLDGYWILLDNNGSVKFVPKKDFEQEYRRL